MRLVSPWATGWTRPPDVATVNDEWGLALILGLVVKEVPYLLLMAFAGLSQVPAAGALRVARSLGYGPASAWLKAVLPMLYPLLRLPIYAVLAFSLSVVDVALILGPGSPPTLAAFVVRWMTSPDLSLWFPAAAGALLLLLLVLGAIALWRGAEWATAALGGAGSRRAGAADRREDCGSPGRRSLP
ncbi:hypothetical protein ACE7GA_09020 [Roseomonas sp. CCTCC AB2023176]|uniref:hypothetical protein n=1 Tax=Roseomonas sp. CCTCC AB2023176 TaxID=3342640 RepID=UPI0035E042C1